MKYWETFVRAKPQNISITMTPQAEGSGNPYMRPVNTKTKCQNLLENIWNPDNKTFFGRTARGWGLLLVFYAIFYAVLAAVFAICMYALLKIVPRDQPMFTLSQSLIGVNPGMGFRPQFLDEGSLIIYNAKNETQIAKYVNQLNSWIDVYTDTTHPDASSRILCDFSLFPHQHRQACLVNTSFGPCSAENHYGYKSMQPCIFIKLNRIYNWEPDYYIDSSDPSMPSDLKAHIDKQKSTERKQVWITCFGEAPGDHEGLNFNLDLSTNVSYYPSQGIPWYYFPYRNQPGYVSPTVAVQFTNLELMGGNTKGGEPNGGTHYVNPYMRKPVNRSLLETVRLAIWNPEEGKVLGRTPKRWGIIGLIYLIMYICIIIFFSLCMCGLMATIDYTTPRYTLEQSIIGNNPGLGYRPLIVEDDKFMYNLIYYNLNDTRRIKRYVSNLNEFLEPYKNKSSLPNKGLNQMICNSRPPDRNMSCAFDVVSEMSNCTAENNYGYDISKPCIFIKLNKLINWIPEYYEDPEDLPSDMPKELKEHIKNITDPGQRKQVWMSCFGERPSDNETIGDLKYYPGPGVPSNYFPYTNTPDYLSPVVAVQFINITRNQIVNVRCRGWAKNLKFANSLGFSNDRLGSCYVQLMIDDN